jgi:hypothetical protein
MTAAMSEAERAAQPSFHSRVFLGEGYETSERRTWAIIWLCAAMGPHNPNTSGLYIGRNDL